MDRVTISGLALSKHRASSVVPYHSLVSFSFLCLRVYHGLFMMNINLVLVLSFELWRRDCGHHLLIFKDNLNLKLMADRIVLDISHEVLTNELKSIHHEFSPPFRYLDVPDCGCDILTVE